MRGLEQANGTSAVKRRVVSAFVAMSEPDPPPPPTPTALPSLGPRELHGPPPEPDRTDPPSPLAPSPPPLHVPPAPSPAEVDEIFCRPMRVIRVKCHNCWVEDEVANMSRQWLGWSVAASMVGRHHTCWSKPKLIIAQMVRSRDWICQFCGQAFGGQHWHACLL